MRERDTGESDGCLSLNSRLAGFPEKTIAIERIAERISADLLSAIVIEFVRGAAGGARRIVAERISRNSESLLSINAGLSNTRRQIADRNYLVLHRATKRRCIIASGSQPGASYVYTTGERRL